MRLAGDSLNVVEQVLRDVAEDHGAGLDPFQGTKGDEAIPTPHIEEDFSLPQLGVGQYLIPDGRQKLERALQLAGVSAESPM
jgi:hypothetical protein